MLEKDPKLSIRKAAKTLDISTATIHCVLRQTLFLFAHKIQTHQALLESDKKWRVEFAKHCQTYPVRYDELLSRIVFSDECIFRLSGIVNKQNVRIWGTARLNEYSTVVMNSPSLMVSCAISEERVLGHYFLKMRTLREKATERCLPIVRFHDSITCVKIIFSYRMMLLLTFHPNEVLFK